VYGLVHVLVSILRQECSHSTPLQQSGTLIQNLTALATMLVALIAQLGVQVPFQMFDATKTANRSSGMHTMARGCTEQQRRSLVNAIVHTRANQHSSPRPPEHS
jgi:hypothetical protein